ncbi:MAG: ribonuclease III [Candidatus Shapirobacteria bacterium]
MKLDELQSKIKVNFQDTTKLAQALNHRSYLNENKEKKLESNERYEFLGDSILELWISDILFKKFPDFNEGDLTNLRSLVVRTENLALVSEKINLGEYIALSKGEENHGGRTNQSILADTFEAIVGAIYLDQGLEAAYKFLAYMLDQSIANLSSKKIYKDPKSVFQEIAQAKRGITPHYKTINESGPDHQKLFEVGVYLNENLITTGKGNSKQKAEEDASIKATKIINNPV